MRRTKIVCTLGPAVDSTDNLRQLILSGMDVARLNFSHGTYEEHEKRILMIRALAEETGRCIALLQDLCGPKIRVGTVAEGTRLRKGATFILTSDNVPGNEEMVSLPIPQMIAAVSTGDRLLLDDGLLELAVIDKTATQLTTHVVTGGVLGSRKGISAPGVRLDIDAVTEKDEQDVAFGMKMGVDFVALSFVRSADDIRHLRQIMQSSAGRTAPIIAKIEKFEAVEALDSILEETDGAMVARGDLGVEMATEEIPMIQKTIIRKCNHLGKPVITATQMLDSMIRNPRPTRAEVTDIANAVLDGTDAVMLSGETAAGAYPIDAVQTMARIAERAEEAIDYTGLLDKQHAIHESPTVTDAIGEAVATIAHDQEAKAIICSTTSGSSARTVARFRPRTPILATTTSKETYQKMALYWGVHPLMVDCPQDTDTMLAQAVEAAVQAGKVSMGDLVVVTAGTPIGVPGSTNLIKVHRVGEPLLATKENN